MCGSLSGGTPGPSSLTSMATRSPAVVAVIVPMVPGGGVHEHVHQQVVDGAAEQFLVADRAQAAVDADPPGPFGVGDPGPLGAPGDHGGHVDGLGGPAGMLAQPGQPEHVVDQPAHPAGLQHDPVHHLVDLVGAAQRALLVELGVGAQRGERGAQLVAGVGEEPAHLLLAGLALVQAGLDPGQHAVQRRAEPAHLAARVVAGSPGR